jgi:hypothetical protein
MTDSKLRHQLEKLHDEIQNTDKVDETGRMLLRDIDGHIRELLARSELEARPGLTRGLEDAIRHFEVTHPTLTTALSELLSTLSNAGI